MVIEIGTKQCFKQFQQELRKLQLICEHIFVSEIGGMNDLEALYDQVVEIERLSNAENCCGVLSLACVKENKAYAFIDYRLLQLRQSYLGILYEIYLMFLKMSYRDLGHAERFEIIKWMLKVMNIGEMRVEQLLDHTNEWDMIIDITDQIARQQKVGFDEDKDSQRFKEMLSEIFRHIQNQELSIQYLAREVLYMNQDYFGRLFYKYTGERFNHFLVRQRIDLAKAMMAFDRDIKVSEVAQLVGYAADGQYFSKNFKKATGFSPVEYREKLE